MELTKDFLNQTLDFGSEWSVERVEIDHDKVHVYIYLKYSLDKYEDPDTNEIAEMYDHCEQHQWRHLDIFHYQSYIRCCIPRVKCKDGEIKPIALAWA